MLKFLILLILPSFCFAAKIQNLEVSYDNYYAKIIVKKSKVEFEDPYSTQSVKIKRCNRAAWNRLLASLQSEISDYELLLNTSNLKKTDTDIIVKRDGIAMPVLRNSSLGNWGRNVESHWKEFVLDTDQNCKK